MYIGYHCVPWEPFIRIKLNKLELQIMKILSNCAFNERNIYTYDTDFRDFINKIQILFLSLALSHYCRHENKVHLHREHNFYENKIFQSLYLYSCCFSETLISGKTHMYSFAHLWIATKLPWKIICNFMTGWR